MPVHILFSTKLHHYKSIIWHGQAVYRHYAKLKNHLKQNLGETYASLFAEPHISEDDLNGLTEAYWSSDSVSAKAVSLSSLPEKKRQRISSELQDRLETLQEYSQKLLESENPEDNRWGQLINKALEIPDESHILVEDNDFILVLWGFEYVKKEDGAYSFKKEFKKPEPPVKKTKVIPPPPPQTPEEPLFDKTEQLSAEPVPEEPESAQTEPQEPEEPATEPSPITSDPSRNAEEQTPETRETPLEKNDTETKPPENAVPQNEAPAKTGHTATRSHWLRRYWWLWLLLLFLLLLFLFWPGHCHTDTGKVLPPEPGKLIPIDSTKIISDPDSIKSIVSDRLNLALKTGSNQDLNAFARRFKELYPGNNYQIIYYDTLTYRLQLLIPAAEREKIKNELPARMPEFKMLIWYEGIFERNYQPNDPGFGDPGQSWYHSEVKAQGAWDVTRGDSNLVVAIIDDGFDLSHPELKGKVFKPWNVPDHSPNVNTGRSLYHGTHVAGIALGWADNGKGVAGIAPNCRFMPVQVGDANGLMGTTAVIDAVLYALNHGAQVINMSLGMKAPPGLSHLPPQAQRDVINRLFKDEEKFWEELFRTAYDRNIFVILAAGNQNLMIGLDPMQRSRYTINVSAVDQRQDKAGFSNYGQLSTISAPGVRMYSSVPGNNFRFLDGTSMAAPVVTGGVALIKSANPAITFDQLVDLLQKTGIPVNAPGQYVGNIIQLDRALGVASQNRKQLPIVDCPDMQEVIDSLLFEIEKIRRLCPKDTTSIDTMRLPPGTKDFSFATGRWKSTTFIQNSDGEQVTIYFDFYSNGTGKITLEEPDYNTCTGDLKLSLRPNQFNIDQINRAACPSKTESYEAYRFGCRPDANGLAECTASNKNRSGNVFTFKLIKIK